MGKGRYFIITTLIVGIITALPKDKIVFEIESPKIPSKSHENISHFASKLPSKDTCGKRKAPSFRIVGGSDSDLGVWPWMVALFYEFKDGSVKWDCGGTLISKQHVLTSASCLVNLDRRILRFVRLGDLDLNFYIDDGVIPLDVPIERVIRHKEYNGTILTNNIGLVVLKNDITFTTFIQPICLPLLPAMKNIDIENNFPFIAGWGADVEGEPPSGSLKEVRVPIIDMEHCKWIIFRDLKTHVNNKTVMDDRLMCAGEKGKDACLILSPPRLCATFSIL